MRTDFLIKVQILLDKAVSNKSQRFLELQRSTYETVVFEFSYSVNYRIIELVFDGDTVSNDLQDFSPDDNQFYVQRTTRRGEKGYSESDSDSSFEGFT